MRKQKCVKCGAHGHQILYSYHKASVIKDMGYKDVVPPVLYSTKACSCDEAKDNAMAEHLHCTCIRCHYCWNIPTDDNEKRCLTHLDVSRCDDSVPQ